MPSHSNLPLFFSFQSSSIQSLFEGTSIGLIMMSTSQEGNTLRRSYSEPIYNSFSSSSSSTISTPLKGYENSDELKTYSLSQNDSYSTPQLQKSGFILCGHGTYEWGNSNATLSKNLGLFQIQANKFQFDEGKRKNSNLDDTPVSDISISSDSPAADDTPTKRRKLDLSTSVICHTEVLFSYCTFSSPPFLANSRRTKSRNFSRQSSSSSSLSSLDFDPFPTPPSDFFRSSSSIFSDILTESDSCNVPTF